MGVEGCPCQTHLHLTLHGQDDRAFLSSYDVVVFFGKTPLFGWDNFFQYSYLCFSTFKISIGLFLSLIVHEVIQEYHLPTLTLSP